MANRTDPLISQVSGSDPQNLLEYLTRLRIYDSRYWKETCFGLTVEDVLEESTKPLVSRAAPLQGPVAVGHMNFLSLALKLLQLHPETDLIVETFVDQTEFKYTRALGAIYLRLCGRPADIYQSLEALYSDGRKLRNYNTHDALNRWNFVHMDEFVHQLLTQPHAVGITLPRLPLRTALQEAGYLPPGPRESTLGPLLAKHDGQPLNYLRHKALVEKYPTALEAWKTKYEKFHQETETAKKEKRPKKKQKSFALFQKSTTEDKESTTAPAMKSAPEEGSDEYWNEQRAKLGMAPLRK